MRSTSKLAIALCAIALIAIPVGIYRHRESGPRDPAAERSIPFQADFAPPSATPILRVLAFGDSGTGGPGQLEVAHAMATRIERSPIEFFLVLGDNFYPDGVASVDDPKWKDYIEVPYQRFGVPLYAVLGNHDHEGNIDAEVERSTRDALWRMPSRFYTFDRTLPDGTKVQFFALDTTKIATGKATVVEQVIWLAQQLSASTADWKIVFGHHPMFSNTESGESKLCAELQPLLARYGVALYLSGHSHAIEVLSPRDGVTQIVSGAGGGTDNPHAVTYQSNTEFAATRGGFVILTIMPQRIAIEAIRGNAKTQFLKFIERP